MKQKPKRRKSGIVRLIVLGIAVYFVASLISLNNELIELQTEKDGLIKEVNTLELGNEELRKLLDSGSYDEIIEKAARERLGWVYSGEEIFIDTSGN